MSFEFRSFRLPEDEAQVLDLLLLGFPELRGTIAGTLEHLRWKFARSTDPAMCLVGFEGERPVSFYGVIPQQYRIDGVHRCIGLVVDVMSHPEVRRRGLFEATGRAEMEQLASSPVEAVIGYPIRDDVMPGHLNIGWKAAFRLPVYVLPVGAVSDRDEDSPAWLPLFGIGATLYRWAARPLRSHRAGTGESLDVDALVEHQGFRSSEEGGVEVSQLDRSAEYLTWRLARPGTDYRIVAVSSDRAFGAAVVRRQSLRGVPSLSVLHMSVNGKSGARLLTGALVQAAREAGLMAVAMCANPAHAAVLGLGRVGFLRTPMKFTLIYRSTGERAVDQWFDNESRWRMSWLDSDTT